MAHSLLSWLLVGTIPSVVLAAIAITGPSGPDAGINSQSGQRPFRQDFNTFKDSGPAFDLYIQAFAQFQAASQSASTPQSYYQVSGIHGYPKLTWDGVTGAQYQAGYCTHNSILFPTWHRPYLALFEQTLWNYAQSIAASYPNASKTTYQQAAQDFRMPYWDWALNATIPDLVNQPTISINTPSGRQSVTNPLYTYKFHPKPPESEFPRDNTGMYKYSQTVRCPDSQGVSQPDVANRNMEGNAQGLHDGTYLLLASEASYGPFSNTGWPSGSQYNSVEDLHNTVHGLVGGSGHMAWVPYSAFDPIFWLHHTNVDRIFAIWQALHSDSFVTSETTDSGTFTNEPGSTEDAETPLTPFHSNTAGTLYTSTSARSTRTFGYSYPEVVDWDVSAEQLASNTRAVVNKLYNPNGTLRRRTRRSKSRHDADADELTKRAAPDAVSADRQWAVNFRGDKSKLPTSLYVHFFLSDPQSQNPTDWPADPGFIATQAVLVDPSQTGAPVVRGQVQLTHALLDGPAPTLTPKQTVDALKAKLQYRVVTVDGTVVPPAQIQGDATVYLEVVSRPVRQTTPEDEFPVYGTWEMYAKGTFQGGTYSLGKSLEWTSPASS